AWTAGIYAVCTLQTFKHVHNDMGIVIPVAVISGIGLATLGRWEPIVGGATIVFALVQLATFTLPEPVLIGRLGTLGWGLAEMNVARPEHWPIEDVLLSLPRE